METENSNPYKKLGGQALIYGLGNIVPRMLNYAVLTFYYTRKFPPEKYGVITELYAYVAIFIVVLTYGMETGLFKFSAVKENKKNSFNSVLSSVIITSGLFAVFLFVLKNNIAGWIGYKGNSEYILYLGLTLSIDAVSAIVFAKMRIENKVMRFAGIKILNVVSTIFFVFLFLEILPALKFITNTLFYQEVLKNIGIGYIFIANLLSSALILLLQYKEFRSFRFSIDYVLLRKVLSYSLPLLIVGLAGIFNETIDRILLRKYTTENLNALYELGIYGANYRIAVLMSIFVQMFRYAAEPFFFNMARHEESKKVYANILKYFSIFLMIIFLGVGLGLDFFKLFIDKDYYEGLDIVPVVLMANVLIGLLFNVNMWYKLSGHTIYGVYITGLGAVVTIVLNIIYIPLYGYHACAWTHLISNGVMLILTYYFGQKVFKIEYDIKAITMYICLGLLFYFIGRYIQGSNEFWNILIDLVFVLIYFMVCNKREKLLGIFIKSNESKNS